MKCPNCKEELKDNLQMVDTGETVYNLFLNKGEIEFGLDTTYFDNNPVVCCGNCCAELFSYDEEKVKKILEGGDLNEMPQL